MSLTKGLFEFVRLVVQRPQLTVGNIEPCAVERDLLTFEQRRDTRETLEIFE